MFESVCIRRQQPFFVSEPLDLVFLVEAMLFYQSVHLIADIDILLQLVPACGPSLVNEFVEEGFLKISYIEKRTGIQVFDAETSKELLEPITMTDSKGLWCLEKVAKDIFSKAAGGPGYGRQLGRHFAELVPTIDIGKKLLLETRSDFADQVYVENAVEQLLNVIAPTYRLPQDYRFKVFKEGNKFRIETNIDFRKANESFKERWRTPTIRDYLVAEINKADSIWLDDRKGILGCHWDANTVYSSCYLIWIALMHTTIRSRINLESIPLLQDKFKKLLNAIDEKQYLENLAELEVAWAFTDRVSPLIIEPLAAESGGTAVSKVKSPDFAFDVSGERVYLEVSYFYVGVLEKWQRAVDTIISTLQCRLNKKGRYLKLHVQLPLHLFDHKQSSFNLNQVIEQVWRKMYTTNFNADEQTVTANGRILWEPYLVAQGDVPLVPPTGSTSGIYPTFGWGWEVLIRVKALKENPSGSVSITPFGVFHSPDFIVDKASFAMQPDIVALSEEDVQAANKMVLNAFINKLQDKRDQFLLRRKNPYFLALKPGNYRLQNSGLVDLIEQEIWLKKEKDYNWITGIILHMSRRGFQPNNEGQVSYCLNPNAVCRASDSLMAMFEGREQFHINMENVEI